MQVWGLAVNSHGTRVVAGYTDPHLEVYCINQEPREQSPGSDFLVSMGLVGKSTTDRTASLSFSPLGDLLACLGAGKAVEIFRSSLLSTLSSTIHGVLLPAHFGLDLVSLACMIDCPKYSRLFLTGQTLRKTPKYQRVPFIYPTTVSYI